MTGPRSILVIRRDNIGDLVCTTPLLAALRGHFRGARVEVLANSYNAPVLAGNPDIDRVHIYQKLKHLGDDGGTISALGGRIALLWSLRRNRYDVVVVASGARDLRAVRLARKLAPRRIVLSDDPASGQHEVERTFTAARSLGVQGPIPALRVVANATALNRARRAVENAGHDTTRKVIGLHISARREMQRWPAVRFAELSMALHERCGATLMLFWSPGGEDHAQHPGDDEKARTIQELVAEKARLVAWPTAGLEALIGGLAACDAVVCSDGGAMHVAAGLGKPIACFFGDSDPARWRPWGVRHTVLMAGSRRVEDVPVQYAFDSAASLLGT